jgi:hypothetical protein
VGIAEQLGGLVHTVPVPPQANDPDITVQQLDLHTAGFVVRCRVGSGAALTPVLVAPSLRDSRGTHYEQAASGADFVAYTPAIPEGVEWLEVLTVPVTRIDLTPGT